MATRAFVRRSGAGPAVEAAWDILGVENALGRAGGRRSPERRSCVGGGHAVFLGPDRRFRRHRAWALRAGRGRRPGRDGAVLQGPRDPDPDRGGLPGRSLAAGGAQSPRLPDCRADPLAGLPVRGWPSPVPGRPHAPDRARWRSSGWIAKTPGALGRCVLGCFFEAPGTASPLAARGGNRHGHGARDHGLAGASRRPARRRRLADDPRWPGLDLRRRHASATAIGACRRPASSPAAHAQAAGCDLAAICTQPGSGSQRNAERRGFQWSTPAR